MTGADDRFDALLEAMLTKPPIKPEDASEGDDDLRDEEE